MGLTASGDCSSQYAAVGTETDSLEVPRPTIRAADLRARRSHLDDGRKKESARRC